MPWISKIIVFLCFLWMLSFALFGGSRWGKDAFSNLASRVFPRDKKGGVPVLMLAIPVLIAATISLIFAPNANGPTGNRTTRTIAQRCCMTPKTFTLWCLILPSVVYVSSSIYRHFRGHDLSTASKLGEIANAFGMMAVLVLSWLLIPVTRLGPISSFLEWHTIHVTLVHIWSGRLLVVASTLHGSFHMLRWVHQGESLANILKPPISCWKDTTFQQTCHDSQTECSCYHHFRNFTGLLALLGLLLVGFSSLHFFRRKFYACFLVMHAVITPLTVLAILMHYNRAVLYAAGGSLYFLASSFPIWIERYRQRSIKIVAVHTFACPTRPCVSLTVEASELAIQRYRPGAFCYVKVPSISKIAHPFSVNLVPRQNKIRIIFRVVGDFTQALEAQLKSTPPELYFHGYYGSNLLDQLLRHDVVVVVAAGIGITPYLSLLVELASKADLLDSTRRRKVILHWICRDSQLIDFCHREYFEELGHKPLPSCLSIEIFIHKTRSEPDQTNVTRYSDEPQHGGIENRESHASECIDLGEAPLGETPFSPTVFTVGERLRNNLAYIAAFSGMTWIGLVVIWTCYINIQHSHEVKGRAYSAFFVGALGLVIGIVANIWCDQRTWDREGAVWNRIVAGDDDVTELDVEDATVISIEMANYKVSTDSRFDATDERAGVTIRQCLGRPTIPEVLEKLKEATFPGLFCCVPPELSQRLRQGIKRESTNAAVYEESFVM
jgi:predicted ferric reductase